MNRKKVICSCKHVTKGDIADAVDRGAGSFKEVKKLTKVSKSCGKCKKKAKKLTKKLLKERVS
ncbi:MAG: (2Fe-2S)-binding protein [Dorea sp.]|nr:(2Fe-2S)-binding protein [Dorea sp.]